MRRAGRFSIPFRYGLPVLLAMMATAFSVFYYQRVMRVAAAEVVDAARYEISALVTETGERLALLFEQGNPLQARRTVSRLALFPKVTQALLVDPEGRLFAGHIRVGIGEDVASHLAGMPEPVRGALALALARPAGGLDVVDGGEAHLLLAQVAIDFGAGQGKPPGRLIVLSDLQPLVDAEQARWRNSLLSELATIFAAALLLWAVLHGLWLRRGKRLLEAAGRLAQGDFSQRLDLAGRDEFARIGQSLDEAADRLARQQADLRRLDQTIAGSPVVVFVWEPSPGWPVQYVSDNIAAWGYAPQDLRSGRVEYLGLIHPDDRARINDALDRQLASPDPDCLFSEEYRVLAADGRVLWVDERSWVERDAQGRPVSAHGVVLDITEKKQIAERLAAKSRLLAVLSAINESIVRERDPQRIMDTACRSVVEKGGFAMAWVGRLDPSSGGLQPFAHAGGDMAPHASCLASGMPGDAEACPSVRAMRERRHVVCPDVVAVAQGVDWRASALGRGFRAIAAFPIHCAGELYGVLSIYAAQAGGFDDEQIGLLLELVEDLGLALDVIRLEAEQARTSDALRQAEHRLAVALEAAELGAWEWQVDSDRVIVNQRWAEMLGETPGSLPQRYMDWLDRLHPEDREHAAEYHAAYIGGRHRHFELNFRARHRDGHWVHALARGSTIAADAAGRPRIVAGIHIDMTRQKQAEAELRLAAGVFDSSHEGIMITDENEHILAVNRAFERLTGYRREEVLGRKPSLLKSGQHGPEFYRAMKEKLRADGYWEGEVWNRRLDGEVFPEWLAISALRDDRGRVRHYIAQFIDISERKENESKLKYLAHYDALTGLPNRALFTDRLGQALGRQRREGGRLAVMFVDLDRFKNVNDSLGHSAGDELLRKIAGRLVALLREGDSVARISGDEFMVLLPEVEGAETAALVAERMLAVVAEPLVIHEQRVSVGASIGIAFHPQDGSDPESLMAAADRAMYEAKDAGRNTFKFAGAEQNTRVLARLSLETQLRAGLAHDEFVLDFQPQFDLASRELVGLEALVRWRHPEHGLLPPGRFIDVAEDSGLIVPLGQWVIEAACHAAMRMRQAGVPDVPISVNVSAVQFRREGFDGQVRLALARSGLPPAALELELTESVLMREEGAGSAGIRRLTDLGIRLAIDDFGTGYSSLAYLHRLAAERLKIDRAFVHGIDGDANAQAIVSAIVALARSFGMAVVAEGVETESEMAHLLALGCPTGQGFLLCAPLAEDELVARFRRHPPA